MPPKLKKLIFSILLIPAFLSCGLLQNNKQKDITLVVPGKRAEGFILSEQAAASDHAYVIDSSSMPLVISELIHSKYIPDFRFNRITYSRNRYIVFLNDGTVSAVAGLNPGSRITDEAVKLSDGVDNFIVSYGNEGLKIVTEGDHKVYIYRELGIAIFDDYGDDRIDMYLVFTPDK